MKIECDALDVTCLLTQFLDRVTESARAKTELAYSKDKVRGLLDRVTNLEDQIDTGSIYITQREIKELIRGVASANKIQAIKSVRALLGLGLKESKDLVEECTAQGYQDMTARQKPFQAAVGGTYLPMDQRPRTERPDMTDEQGTEGRS
jgi:hypothetical protein